MLGEPTPHEADPIGSQYAFEKRVAKASGGDGFAVVWKRDFFAWEYKGKYKDLKAAYVQLLGYKGDLGNPPLLVVSDPDRMIGQSVSAGPDITYVIGSDLRPLLVVFRARAFRRTPSRYAWGSRPVLRSSCDYPDVAPVSQNARKPISPGE